MNHHPKKNEQRILVIGADSMIGSALSQKLRRLGKNILETTRRSETLSNERIFLDFDKDISSLNVPDNVFMAFFCAATSSLEYCRREPAKTRKVNIDNTVKIAEMLVKKDVSVVFLSTNLIHDGSVPFVKADAPVSPRTEHGYQKAEAEKRLLELGDLITVIRLSKILCHRVPLIQDWTFALQNQKVIHPFYDKVVAPLPLSFAVGVLSCMTERQLPGIIQVSGNQDVTYAQLAIYLAKQMEVNQDLIQPICAKESGMFLEHLPSHTTMDNSRLIRELKMEAPNVLSFLDSLIAQSIATTAFQKSLNHLFSRKTQ